MRLYIPQRQREHIKDKKLFGDLDRHKANRIFPEQLPGLKDRAVMFLRPFMIHDRGVGSVLDGAGFTYSMWKGYLKGKTARRVLTWLEEYGIPWQTIHTSGHASPADLQRFAAALAPRTLVPIHSFETGRFAEFFDNVVQKEDGEWWGCVIIEPTRSSRGLTTMKSELPRYRRTSSTELLKLLREGEFLSPLVGLSRKQTGNYDLPLDVHLRLGDEVHVYCGLTRLVTAKRRKSGSIKIWAAKAYEDQDREKRLFRDWNSDEFGFEEALDSYLHKVEVDSGWIAKEGKVQADWACVTNPWFLSTGKPL